MNSKELASELKVVIRYLWCAPCLPITKLHLSSYVGKTQKIEWLEDGWKCSSRYKTVWSFIHDEMYIYDLIIDQYFLTWDILLEYGVGPERTKRIMRTWISKVSRWRISPTQLGKLLKELTSAILTPVADSETEMPERVSVSALKAKLKETYPECYWFWHPIIEIYHDWVHTGALNAFRLCYQFSEYMQRATIDAAVDPSEMRNEYITFERQLVKEGPDPKSLVDFRAIIRTMIDEQAIDIVKNNFCPAHGSGATSTNSRRSLAFKYSSLVQLYKVQKEIKQFADFLPTPVDGYYGYEPWYSEIVNVPKNLLKRRIISKEPITVQYAQHGIAYGLNVLFEHPRYSFWRHINLHRGDLNGKLAAIGSYASEYATVDLSSASDSVTVRHVACFRKRLARLLLAARAGQTLYDDELINLHKFAPMGADTCFKVECLMFFFCCVLAIARTHRLDVRTMTKDDFDRLIQRSRFRVYGDDIVIEAQYVPELYQVLASLGFTVNNRKSYTQRRALAFRESCGYEYLCGMDVSPLRTPRKRRWWCSHLLSADKVSALIEFHNNAYLAGWFALAKLQLRRIRRTYIKLELRGYSPPAPTTYKLAYVAVMGLIPFVHISDYEEERSALVTHYPPSNFHMWKGRPLRLDGSGRNPHWELRTRSRFDHELDQEEIRTLTNRGFVPLELDSARYAEWWLHRLRWQDTPDSVIATEMTAVGPQIGCRTLIPIIKMG